MNQKKWIKGIIFLLLFLFIGYFLISNIDKTANNPKYKKKLWEFSLNTFLSLPDPIKSTIMIFSGKRSFSNLFNDYNVKFLPDTQLIKIDFSRKNINFENKNKKKFYIEKYNNQIIVANKFGEFFTTKSDLLASKEKNIFKPIKVKNLNNVQGDILDLLIIDKTIYVSKISNFPDCTKLEIYSSELKEEFNFSIFKSFDECKSISIGAGRIKHYVYQNQNGILISTNDSDNDNPGSKAQDNSSIFGKILFVDIIKKDHSLVSIGHRNVQGLFVKENIILATEHGPRGGDEINKIIHGENYGWPIVSYGDSYQSKELKYLKSHKENGFREPLHAFVPSIGISELIILPNNFNTKWKNNALVTSLNGRSIYRVKFEDESFNKILYTEKIFIGERIRDILYVDNSKLILVALERTGNIGILKNITD